MTTAKTPTIEGLDAEDMQDLAIALDMPYPEAAQYYELYQGTPRGTKEQDLFLKARGNLQLIYKAARLYQASQKGVDTASHESAVDENPRSAPLLRRFTDSRGNQLVEVAAWFYDEMVALLPDEDAPKAGQVDVDLLKVECLNHAFKGITGGRGSGRSFTMNCIMKVVDYLHTQGYFDKPIAGLREKIKKMEKGPLSGLTVGQVEGYNAALADVIELIDRGAE